MKELLLILIALATTQPAQAPTNAELQKELTGTWKGTSLCTPVRPACHDEIAIYHFTPHGDSAVTGIFNKEVGGKEVEMGGSLEFPLQPGVRKIVGIMHFKGNDGRWVFAWTGKKMKGTAEYMDGTVIRNIQVEKVP